MLKYRADLKSLLYMGITTSLFIFLWNAESFNIFLYLWHLFMAVSVSVMAHNHNHLPMWHSKAMNTITDWWITCFYGFPIFAWTPTHNQNHHKFVNKEPDYTKTYRYSEKNNFLTFMTYPSVSGYFQQSALLNYLKDRYKKNRTAFWMCILQIVILVSWIAFFLILDWKKALIYVVAPQQVSLFAVLIFNYIQHVHADEESDYNHSRNIVGSLNFFLFNNGLHTAHHMKANLHWSLLPEAHAKIEPLIDPSLNERSFWWYVFRVYILGMFGKRFRTKSMRLERMRAEK